TWEGVTIDNRLGRTSVPIELGYAGLLIDTLPLGKHPLDALRFITATMQCYVYFDYKTNKLVLLTWKDFTTRSATKTISAGMFNSLSNGEEDFMWDKLVDRVEVHVLSHIPAKDAGGNFNGSFLDGFGYAG